MRLLEKVRELANGMVQARCPACAEGGQDRAGEHLRLYPDGRFGCCVHPKDREHRKRIFALASDKSPRTFSVKLASAKTATESARSVMSSLTRFGETLATPISESVSIGEQPSHGIKTSANTSTTFGTLGTPILIPYAYKREDVHDDTHICKDLENAVPSVPKFLETADNGGQRRPFLTVDGTLSIPFDSPERYHWWKGGQSVAQTLIEVRV